MAVSGVSFGALAIFARIAYDAGAEPIAVLFMRFVIAAACMVAIMAAGGYRFPRGRTLAALLALGGIGYVGESLAYFVALTLASAGLVALLLYLYPVMVTLLAAALFGERLGRAKAFALALAVGGSALTIGRAGGGRPLGIVLGLVSAATYAVYIVASSRVTPRAGAIPSSTVVMLAAAGAFGLLALIQRPSFPQTPAGWAAIAALALVSTVVAIVSFFAGLARIGPSDASTVSTLEPMVTVALAALVLGERINGIQLVGGVLILAAVIMLARGVREPLIPAEGPPT